MDSSSEKSRSLRGIAALFDDMERKDLFRRYLYFLCWVELGILLTCWLYQIGESGRDGEPTFPWRLYFLVAFLAPIAITFIVGTVVVGFNKYFAEPDPEGSDRVENEAVENAGTGRIQHLTRMVDWIQKLPFLALLLLLSVGVAFFYKIDTIIAVIGGIGEKSFKFLLISFIVILLLASVFGLILIILNYRLRKTAMEYHYKAQVAEKFGLVILEDNTVLNSSGRLLVNGAKFKKAAFQLLPEGPVEKKSAESEPIENSCAGSISRPADLET